MSGISIWCGVNFRRTDVGKRHVYCRDSGGYYVPPMDYTLFIIPRVGWADALQCRAEFTRWVIESALHKIQEWQAVPVSINISAKDVAHAGLCEVRYPATRALLGIECLEIFNNPGAISVLGRFQRKGIIVSLDNFGWAGAVYSVRLKSENFECWLSEQRDKQN